MKEKEKDKPKNLHLDFTCNYRKKNNVNYFLGFLYNGREINLSEKIPHLRLKTTTLIFPMILKYKTVFFKNLGVFINGRRTNFPRKIP